MSRTISDHIQRRLYSESMGRCMNPDCKVELFRNNGDIIEKAHLTPFCDSQDNSFENLVVLCPNCHTDFDKNDAFTKVQVEIWKQNRKEEFDRVFGEKFNTFDELRSRVAILLKENKAIFENYYINDKKELWNVFEGKILANNNMLKKLLEQNRNLIQRSKNESYSNLALIDTFLVHIAEFESTRPAVEKHRQVLFPKEINSLFGIEAVSESLFPSVESLEILIDELQRQGKFVEIVLGIDNPYLGLVEDDKVVKLYLKDTPRLRQFYFDYGCFRGVEVRLDSLNFAYKFMKSRGVMFEYNDYANLREVIVKGKKMIFIYNYCLSKVDLMKLAPSENSIIVNLHNWNGKGCISSEAYALADEMAVTLLTMDRFYVYINKLK
ncbi:HNH endonuclease [Paenibacillus polysaccharolyticus]|uniref:HNH endonuclease signature motif containing protein n=1 Tax=Paenibacillus polysaccharolyticus TaxID=582692 RepID=UPI00209E3B15|nr:HNH endonuclease signature motif containing protein [Paenibacillus polysaccharolyticus]MCP1134474.1 HNH endonuclease [Paenibacillus polysaccharolyticus]